MTTYDLGAGTDAVTFTAATAAVVVDLSDRSRNAGAALGSTFLNVENLVGSEFSDDITGDQGDNLLIGEAGDDEISGGAGDDQLRGDDGDDIIRGDDGGDTISGGAGNNTLDGGEGLDIADYDGFASFSVHGQNIIDFDLFVPGSIWYVWHGSGPAEYDQLSGFEGFGGSTAADRISGDARSNVLLGNGGNDELNGRGGVDWLVGGDGDDVISGGDGDDQLRGNEGNDIINGDDGGDTISGGNGNNVLDGGEGIDIADYVALEGFYVHGQNLIDFAMFPAGTWYVWHGPQDDPHKEYDALSGFEGFGGSSNDDTIRGDDRRNPLLGNDGNDVLDGRGGGDWLIGGEGDDTLIGGSNTDSEDTLNGGDGHDIASYQTATSNVNVYLFNSLFNAGADAVGDVYVSIEGLEGSEYADILSGDDNANTLKGRAGNDALYGGVGDDVLDGGRDADRLDGGLGIDTASYVSASSGVVIDLSRRTSDTGDAAGDVFVSIEAVQGSLFNDEITGDALGNILSGSNGDDKLNGGLGDDRLVGGQGADRLDGGEGWDIVSYASSGNGITLDLEDRRPEAHPEQGEAKGDIFVAIEAFEGTAYTDRLYGDDSANAFYGHLGDDYLKGKGGNDLLYGQSGADTIEGDAGDDQLHGGADRDKLSGGEGRDFIFGNDGNDWLDGGEGDDCLVGGLGDDTYVVESNLDGIFEINGEGLDTVVSTAAFTQLDAGNTLENLTYGGTGNGTLYGNSLGNVLTGGAGSDSLNGFFGVDVLYGGNGNDFLYIDHQDFVNGGDGFDAVYIQTTTGVTLNLATSFVEYVVGFSGNDVLNGSGSTVSVTLLGGAGADFIMGGTRSDYLYGNAGADIFRVTANAQFDAIFDFVATGGAENDQIDVRGLGAGFDTLSEVLAATTDYSGTSVINFGSGNQLYLYQVAKASLTADDFIFG